MPENPKSPNLSDNQELNNTNEGIVINEKNILSNINDNKNSDKVLQTNKSYNVKNDTKIDISKKQESEKQNIINKKIAYQSNNDLCEQNTKNVPYYKKPLFVILTGLIIVSLVCGAVFLSIKFEVF
ncbi:hypothetical protein GVAV_001584 [Gurleya vavrai]